jgi:hypothetical protein
VTFAKATRTSAQCGSIGCKSSVHSGRRWNWTFAGVPSPFVVDHPVRSTTHTRTLFPSGSACAAVVAIQNDVDVSQQGKAGKRLKAAEKFKVAAADGFTF